MSPPRRWRVRRIPVLLREILRAHLTEQVDARMSEEIRDGYDRILPATPDGWDDLERFTDAASIEVLERFDAEERREGQGPW